LNENGDESMKKIISVFVVLFFWLGLVSLLFGQDVLNKMKETYGYDNWPGKTGGIKQEPPLDLLILPGFVFIDKTTGDNGTTYRWGETMDNPRVLATVKSYSTIEEAQLSLLNNLSQFSTILPNVETYGIKVGDVGFAISENDIIVLAAFVKKNITVVVKNLIPDNPKSVRDIALQIDLMI
jgi:hypothetical protein